MFGFGLGEYFFVGGGGRLGRLGLGDFGGGLWGTNWEGGLGLISTFGLETSLDCSGVTKLGRVNGGL